MATRDYLALFLVILAVVLGAAAVEGLAGPLAGAAALVVLPLLARTYLKRSGTQL